MDWTDNLLDQLSALPTWGYRQGSEPAAEPTALAALALLGHGRADAARPALEWLEKHQAADGGLAVTQSQASPNWATGWAVLAWRLAQHRANGSAQTPFSAAIQRALGWILQMEGVPLGLNDEMGHDCTIVAWPWVAGTHSWIEPTAMNVLALRASGYAKHRRTRDGLRMLVDRLLPGGGANYGNTLVLGQYLRPHVQPTGLALLAVLGQNDPRIGFSLDYLMRECSRRTATASLCYAAMALAAHGRPLPDVDDLLRHCFSRTMRREAAPYKMALLALASLGHKSPLNPTSQTPVLQGV